MAFIDSIPDRLQEYPTTVRFLELLDNLYAYKQEIINSAIRVNNFGVSTDRKWLLKRLEEYGVNNLPYDYPFPVLQQFLLNADTIFRLRGSVAGVELYCSVLTLGEVTIDAKEFTPRKGILLLDDKTYGYITDDDDNQFFRLSDNSFDINEKVILNVTIRSKYFNGEYPTEEKIIKSYLEQTFSGQLPFSPNKEINYTYLPREEFYFHKLLNPYFV